MASDHHYAVVAFCQKPGSGKSRSVASIGDVPSICLFHLCLRPDGQQGAPVRAPLMAAAIDGCSTAIDFSKAIAGCLEAHLAPPLEKEEPAVDRKASFSRTTRPAAEGYVGDEVEEVVQKCHLLADRVLFGVVKLFLLAFDKADALCQGGEGPEAPLLLGGPHCFRGQGAWCLFRHV